MARAATIWLLMGLASLGLLAALHAAGGASAAPWATPGGGNSYNMSTLDAAAPGGSINILSGACHYRMVDTATISAGDTLTIDAGCTLEFDNARNLTVIGRLLVQGNATSPVLMDSSTGSPTQGAWGGVTFVGAPFAPSVVDNLTMQWSTFGIRCLACQNLTVRSFYVELNTGDGILVQASASNLTLNGIAQVVTSYQSQSVVGVSGASYINGSNITGSGNADVLTLWNVSNVLFTGGVSGTGTVIADAWIDNATNVTVTGASGGTYPTGFRVTRSSGVTFADVSFSIANLSALNATQVDRLTVTNFTLDAGASVGVILTNVTNATLSGVSLTTLQTALWLQGGANTSIGGLSAAAGAAALLINRSTNVTVANASLAGTAPATVWVNASSNVALSNVDTNGGAVGVLVVASSNVTLSSCSVLAAMADGVQASLSPNLVLNGTAVEGSGARGLNLSADSDARISASDFGGNGGEGIWAQSSTLRVSATNASGNGLDGVALVNGSLLNASSLNLEGNGRYGLWVRGGSVDAAALAVRLNAGDGVLVENGTLTLTDGVFENNTGLGINYTASAAGGWAISGASLLANNGAVLTGGVAAVGGGELTVLNAAIALRGSAAAPFVFDFSGGASLWLDGATLSPANASARYRLSFAGGSDLAALESTLTSPSGAGPLFALLVDGGSATLRNVTVQGAVHSVHLRASAGDFADTSISNSITGGLDLDGGSTLLAVRLHMSGAGGLSLDGSSADLFDSDFTGIGDAAVSAVAGSSFNGTRVVVNGSASEGLLLDASAGTLSDSTLGGAGAFTVSAWNSSLSLSNVTLLPGAAGGLLASNSSTVDGANVTVPFAAGDAVYADNGSVVTLTDFTAESPAGNGITASAGASIVLLRASVSGGAYGVSLNGASLQAADLHVGASALALLALTASATADITRGLFDNATQYAIYGVGSGDLTLRASSVAADGVAALFVSVAGDILIENSTCSSPSGTCLSVDHVLSLTVLGANVSGAAGMSVASVGNLTLNDSTVQGGNFGVSTSAVTRTSLSNLTVGAGLLQAFGAAGGGDLSAERITATGFAGAVRLDSLGTVWLVDLTLSSNTTWGLQALGCANVTWIGGLVDGGVRINGSSQVALADVESTSASGGQAFDVDGAGASALSNLTAHARGAASTGFLLADDPALTAADLKVDGTGAFTGVSGQALSNASFSGVWVLGARVGFLLANSSSVALDNLTLTGGDGVGIQADASTAVALTDALLDGAQTGLAATFGAAIVGTNATMRNMSVAGVRADGGASVDLWGSSIAGAAAPGGFAAVNATAFATVRLYDTAASNSTFVSAPNGTVEVWWSLRFEVLAGTTPEPATTVWLRDATLGLVRAQTTDLSGLTPFAPTLALRDTGGARTRFDPFTVNATVSAGWGGNASFGLAGPLTFTLSLGDTSPPSLEVRANLRVARGAPVAFLPDAGDGDNVGITRYAWSFLNETGVATTLSGSPGATYAFSAYGSFTVTVAAFDAAGNHNERTFQVLVNSPPYFLDTPVSQQLYAVTGVLYTWDFTASDNDSADVAGLAYRLLDSPPGATLVGTQLRWTPSVANVYAFTVSVSDGLDTTSFSFNLLVSTPNFNNRAPVFLSEPVEGASVTQDYAYDVQVEDPDGDPVVVQLASTPPPGMSFTQTSALRGRLTWSPGLYYPRGAEAYNVSFEISLLAWDRSNFTYQNYTLLLRNPPDERPLIGDFADLSLGQGEVRAIDLSLFATDADDNASTLRWSIKQPADTQGAVIGFDTEDPFRLIVRAPEHIEGSHSFYINITVKDSSGRSDSRNVLVELHGPTTIESAFPWLLLLLLVGGVGAVYALATRQRGGLLADEEAAAPGGGPSASPAQTAVPAGDAGFPFYLEGAALFDQSDNLIASATEGGDDLEGLLVLIPSKARALRPSEDALTLSKVEGRDVALMRKGDAVVAALGTFAGDPSPWLEEPVRATLEQVQARAEEVAAPSLESLSNDAGVAQALKALLALGAGSSPQSVARYARESSVRAASVVEHVQGFLRLKVALDNGSAELAGDVRLSVEFDDKVLRLERVEPAVDQRRDKFHLGNLRPGERKTLAFYFDPQICTRSFFNATVGWEDPRGAFHSTAMRTRPAEVVCPAFSTPRQANTAMLRRLLQEELAYRDSKYFRFPKETSAEQVFEACKQAVLAQEVRLVREFSVERPYRAEAWFYGETAANKSPMVIWTAVFGAERVAQFSCASNAHASITGLLAELGRRLVDSRAGGGVGAPIETMGKSAAAAEVGDRPTLFSKSQQGEIDAGEDRGAGASREDGR